MVKIGAEWITEVIPK